MANQITAAGLEVNTRAQNLEIIEDAQRLAYGSDINLEQSTPDGAMNGTFVQCIQDLADLIVGVNSQFDPDQAVGITLDQRVAINGIQRQGGTYTVTPITMVIDQPVNLFGLDQSVEEVYFVMDGAGTRFQLVNSQIGISPGTYQFNFRAEEAGRVLTVPNTIQTPGIIILGVSSVNNPTAATETGVPQESDQALKLRRQISVSLPSQGYYASLKAALLNIPGVTSAEIYENRTGATDANGVPSHSIWVVVSGAGDPAAIANAIYTKRNAGAGMFGDIEFIVTQVDRSQIAIRWSDVEAENLHLRFSVSSIDGVTPPNTAAMYNELPKIFTPGVAQGVNINQLATLVQQIDPNSLVTDAGFSFAAIGPFTPTLEPSAKNKQFVVSAVNIQITVI